MKNKIRAKTRDPKERAKAPFFLFPIDKITAKINNKYTKTTLSPSQITIKIMVIVHRLNTMQVFLSAL